MDSPSCSRRSTRIWRRLYSGPAMVPPAHTGPGRQVGAHPYQGGRSPELKARLGRGREPPPSALVAAPAGERALDLGGALAVDRLEPAADLVGLGVEPEQVEHLLEVDERLPRVRGHPR